MAYQSLTAILSAIPSTASRIAKELMIVIITARPSHASAEAVLDFDAASMRNRATN